MNTLGQLSSRKRPVIVLTGASAGVGRATARLLARRYSKTGVNLVLLARGCTALSATRQEVESLGSDALTIPTDVADATQVERAATLAEEAFGPIDLWINNAMCSVFSPVAEMKAEEIRRVTEVTYLGTVHGTLSALKRMRARNRGTIIQVGSALAYRSIPLQAAYCAAKHAVTGFTESLRTELMHERSQVKVSLVHLPAINTPQFSWVKSRLPRKPQPVPPIFQPEVAARAILWAAQNPKPERFVGFPTVKAVVAERISPRLGDLYLSRKGFDSQQTEEPESPDREDNLWSPIDEDRGAHGTFDRRSRTHSWQLFFAMHPWWLALSGMVSGGLAYRALTSLRQAAIVPADVRTRPTPIRKAA